MSCYVIQLHNSLSHPHQDIRNQWSCICVLWVSILSLSMIFLLDYRIFLMGGTFLFCFYLTRYCSDGWYFCFCFYLTRYKLGSIYVTKLFSILVNNLAAIKHLADQDFHRVFSWQRKHTGPLRFICNYITRCWNGIYDEIWLIITTLYTIIKR